MYGAVDMIKILVPDNNKKEGWDLENGEMGWVLCQYSHTEKGSGRHVITEQNIKDKDSVLVSHYLA